MALPNLDYVLNLVNVFPVRHALQIARKHGEISERDYKLLDSMHHIRYSIDDDLVLINKNDHRYSKLMIGRLPNGGCYIHGDMAAVEWAETLIQRARQGQVMRLGAIWLGYI